MTKKLVDWLIRFLHMKIMRIWDIKNNSIMAYMIKLMVILSLVVFPFSMSHASVPAGEAELVSHESGKVLHTSHSKALAPSMAEHGSDKHNLGHDDQSCCPSFCGAALVIVHPKEARFKLAQDFISCSAKSVDLVKWHPPYRPPNL